MVILKTEVITKPITRVGEKRERTEREREEEREIRRNVENVKLLD